MSFSYTDRTLQDSASFAGIDNDTLIFFMYTCDYSWSIPLPGLAFVLSPTLLSFQGPNLEEDFLDIAQS